MASKVNSDIYCYSAGISQLKQGTSSWQRTIGKIMSKETGKAASVRQIHSLELRDHEVAAEYLCAALDDGDSAVILMALRTIAEAQADGISGLATRSNLGRESMYKMLSKTGNPKLSSFTRVIHALGLKLKVEQDVHREAS
jgi:probable addiction module antidote protein